MTTRPSVSRFHDMMRSSQHPVLRVGKHFCTPQTPDLSIGNIPAISQASPLAIFSLSRPNSSQTSHGVIACNTITGSTNVDPRLETGKAAVMVTRAQNHSLTSPYIHLVSDQLLTKNVLVLLTSQLQPNNVVGAILYAYHIAKILLRKEFPHDQCSRLCPALRTWSQKPPCKTSKTSPSIR